MVNKAILPDGNNSDFVTKGKTVENIDVRISYKIISLFSEGLYRSPNKAIEELVANSFDAGATKVHVVMSPDFGDPKATIAVIDNGIGMDKGGLNQHWLIGVSNKRDPSFESPKGRKQIGKFGIGKLATYVLSTYLTHISKINGKYYATTMDYSLIPPTEKSSITIEEKIQIPLRELTEEEAKEVLAPWLQGNKPGFKNIALFGEKSEQSWTIAIMSGLKPIATEIQRGRLSWVLQTAMPLRDDFNLYLDGNEIAPSKLKDKKIKAWVLGRDLKEVPSPAPDDLQVTEDTSRDKKSMHYYGLTDTQLGRVTGYVELYEDLLTVGKSGEIGRSHGFFVYVMDRLINIDDEYFGIDSNLLRHGTFARFRMIVHIDRLDEGLRSSRESIQEGPLIEKARNILRGVFVHVRAEHEKIEKAEAPGVQSTSRIADSPNSLTRQPLIELVNSAFNQKYSPRYTTYPLNLSPTQKIDFITRLKKKAEESEGLVSEIKLVDELSQGRGITVFNIETGTLAINTLHPFVAHYLDEYDHRAKNIPLELMAMSEVLLEAHLVELGLDASIIADVLSKRDELLRCLSRSTGKRNAYHISSALSDAATDKDKLEIEVVAAFDSIGFSNVVRIGKSGKPDGYAEAHLSGTADGKIQSYKITLEAKTKEKPNTKVSAKTVGISTIARQRNDFNANYAIVVGPDFPTTELEKSALAKEIKDDRDKNPGKGITLIRIEDMARLVRLIPAKRVGLHRLRELFDKCSIPEESKAWIENLTKEKMDKPPYKELLDSIWSEQRDMPGQAIQYANVETRLRLDKKISLARVEVEELCKALSKMAPGFICARQSTVELNQQPSKILESISSTIKLYPEDEQKTIALPS
ncbi:MAG: ATP-binding protein [Planctomycetota bacterium]